MPPVRRIRNMVGADAYVVLIYTGCFRRRSGLMNEVDRRNHGFLIGRLRPGSHDASTGDHPHPLGRGITGERHRLYEL